MTKGLPFFFLLTASFRRRRDSFQGPDQTAPCIGRSACFKDRREVARNRRCVARKTTRAPASPRGPPAEGRARRRRSPGFRPGKPLRHGCRQIVTARSGELKNSAVITTQTVGCPHPARQCSAAVPEEPIIGLASRFRSARRERTGRDGRLPPSLESLLGARSCLMFGPGEDARRTSGCDLSPADNA